MIYVYGGKNVDILEFTETCFILKNSNLPGNRYKRMNWTKKE